MPDQTTTPIKKKRTREEALAAFERKYGSVKSTDLNNWEQFKLGVSSIGTFLLAIVFLFLVVTGNGGNINIGSGSITTTESTTETTTDIDYASGATSDLQRLAIALSEEAGVEPPFIQAIIFVESFWNIEAKGRDIPLRGGGSTNAIGLMQVLPSSAEAECGLTGSTEEITKQLYDPETNIRCGIKIFKRYRELARGDLVVTFASYNAGPGNAEQAVKERWPETTLHYLKAKLVTPSFDPYRERCQDISCVRMKPDAKQGGPNDPRLDQLAIAVQSDEFLGARIGYVSAFNDGHSAHNPDGYHPKGKAVDFVVNSPFCKDKTIARLEDLAKEIYPDMKFRIVDEVESAIHLHFEITEAETGGESL
jgi:hypothetical protein